ncbi:MAG: lysylphosphatidylglycerol synthase transmembrane domain-containing protein [Solirubrobacteraceae bacterium]
MTRRLLIAFGFAVTVVMALLAVRGVHPDQVGDALSRATWAWLLPAFLVLLVANLLKAVRWRAIYGREDRPPLRPVTEALFIGYFFNNILPLRAGEAARVIALHQRTDASRALTTGTVVVERVYDVLSLVFLLFLALPWLPAVSWLRAAATLAVATGVAIAIAVAVLAVYEERPLRYALRPLHKFGLVSDEKMLSGAQNLLRGLAAIRNVRVAAEAFAWSLVSWLVMAFSFWLVMLAFDLDLSPVAALFALVAIGLGMILPSLPAAVGVFEAAVVVALLPYNIDKSLALSFALVLHALNFLLYMIAGAIVLKMHAAGMRRTRGATVS